MNNQVTAIAKRMLASLNVPQTTISTRLIKISDYLEKTVIEYIENIQFKPIKTDIEGESKIVYRIPDTNVCLIKLKPTMYSYTHNRYGTVTDTDILRNKFWQLFAKELNESIVSYIVGGAIPYASTTMGMLKNINIRMDYPFLSSYIGEMEIDGEIYNICYYVEDQSPLEMVWKDYFLGTLKHTLIDVPKWKTKNGTKIQVNGKLPNSMIRFDWRNPFEHNGARAKDEAISDDFANYYTDVDSAKHAGMYASNIIKEFIGRKGYVFVDTCYFINTRGNMIYSEITPDGMRIRKEGSSFDKDLWRLGKDDGEIVNAWKSLYAELTE